MKKVVISCLMLFLFVSCENSNLRVEDNAIQNEDTNQNTTQVLNKLNLNDDDVKYLIEVGETLYKSGYSQKSIDVINEGFKIKYGESLPNSDVFVTELKKIKENISTGSQLRKGNNSLSDEGIKLLEKIKEELEKSTDESSFMKAYDKSKKYISDHSFKVKDDELLLISFNLEVVKNLALSNNSKNARPNVDEPSCKWYQWGCVIYMTTAQLPLLMTIWYASPNDALRVLVAATGIDYIAQCCGFCGCQCPEGCPMF